MANVNLKTDFKNGETLFDYQLNNNFKAIEAALEAMNAIVWQDNADKVVTFRGTTEELMNREIIDGQILYDTTTGESYIDYEGNRISTGSGNAIHIGDTEPTNASTQLWINDDELAGVGSEVVNSLEGNQERMAPSVAAVKNYIYGYILYEDAQGSIGNIELNEDVSNYSIIKIFYNRNGLGHNSTEVETTNTESISLVTSYYSDSQWRIYSRNININGKNLTNITEQSLSINVTPDTDINIGYTDAHFKITKVIGYK